MLGWLNRRMPSGPVEERRGFNWRVVGALVVLVPLFIVVGALALEQVSGTKHPMVGRCVSYSGGSPEAYGFGSVQVVDCDGPSRGKGIAVVDDKGTCPTNADDAFIANFGGDAGKFCIKTT